MPEYLARYVIQSESSERIPKSKYVVLQKEEYVFVARNKNEALRIAEARKSKFTSFRKYETSVSLEDVLKLTSIMNKKIKK